MTAEEPARLLIVDDEPNIVDLLITALRFNGFVVDAARTGAAALQAAAERPPDLVVLDVMLPDIDGFGVCRALRAAGSDVPIVFLTARDAHADAVLGLTYGGDDYVTKPFSVDELVARIRAVLRRTRAGGGAAAPRGSVWRLGDLELDEEEVTVRRAGHEVELSRTEFNLLHFFLQNPNRVLRREQILDAVWRHDFAGGTTVVDTYVSYLRRKLHRHGPPLIHTQRGFGYVLRDPARR